MHCGARIKMMKFTVTDSNIFYSEVKYCIKLRKSKFADSYNEQAVINFSVVIANKIKLPYKSKK